MLNKQFPFMGAMYENFVSQQFKNIFDIKPRYFTFGTRYETDFLMQYKTDIVPIEVKSGESVKSNSMTNYIKRYDPHLAIRYSKLWYKREGRLVNIPLWLVHKTMELVWGWAVLALSYWFLWCEISYIALCYSVGCCSRYFRWHLTKLTTTHNTCI